MLNPCTKTAKCYVKQNWRERTLKLRMSPYRLGKDFNIKKPRFSGITKHGCTQIIFYILTIQMVSVGPTKVYLNTHKIHLLGGNIFPYYSSDQMFCANCC